MDFKKEIEVIKSRNKRVEVDKAWETCWTRRLFIAVITYFIASILLWFMDNTHPLFNALIPTIGYILSTLSLPFIKQWWLRSLKK